MLKVPDRRSGELADLRMTVVRSRLPAKKHRAIVELKRDILEVGPEAVNPACVAKAPNPSVLIATVEAVQMQFMLMCLDYMVTRHP